VTYSRKSVCKYTFSLNYNCMSLKNLAW
jgi:hypothetical protein